MSEADETNNMVKESTEELNGKIEKLEDALSEIRSMLFEQKQALKHNKKTSVNGGETKTVNHEHSVTTSQVDHQISEYAADGFA